jgi:hypothetical protein
LRVDVVGELDVELDDEGTLVEGLLPGGHALVGDLLEVARLDHLPVAELDQQRAAVEVLEGEGKTAERFKERYLLLHKQVLAVSLEHLIVAQHDTTRHTCKIAYVRACEGGGGGGLPGGLPG